MQTHQNTPRRRITCASCVWCHHYTHRATAQNGYNAACCHPHCGGKLIRTDAAACSGYNYDTESPRRLWRAVGCLFLSAACIITLGGIIAAILVCAG